MKQRSRITDSSSMQQKLRDTMAVFNLDTKPWEVINGQFFVTHFQFQLPEKFEWTTYRMLREKGMLGRDFNLREYYNRKTYKTLWRLLKRDEQSTMMNLDS